MGKHVAVISLDAFAGAFYARQVQGLFGDRVEACSYSVLDGSVERMPRKYDLYMVTTDAFNSLGDLRRYVPIDGEVMEIHVTFRWDVVRRLQALPAGRRALFVNLSDKMCREAVSRLNQLGVNQLEFDLFFPGAPEPDMARYDYAITPEEVRYVPAGAREIINIGQRGCDSSTMIEAALRLGFEELLEDPAFVSYQREMATTPTASTGCSPGACGWRASSRCSWTSWTRGSWGSTRRERSLPATASWRRSPASPARGPSTARQRRSTPSCPLPNACPSGRPSPPRW